MRLLAALAFAVTLHAQDLVTVTFAQTGLESVKALTGIRIKGIEVLGVELCSSRSTATVIPAQRIYQAGLSHNVPLISPLTVAPILARTKNRNPYQIALDIGGTSAGVAALLTASRVVAATSPWTTGFVLGYQLYSQFRPSIAGRVPDASAVTNALLRDNVALPANGCASALALGRYLGNMSPVVVSIPLN